MDTPKSHISMKKEIERQLVKIGANDFVTTRDGEEIINCGCWSSGKDHIFTNTKLLCCDKHYSHKESNHM
ncbi:hypothetical protein M0802_005817 [Mischocyttarus mexicanus]|nr:hypothetical protein M0802_005817 [Mischocyttarus mexicanus]